MVELIGAPGYQVDYCDRCAATRTPLHNHLFSGRGSLADDDIVNEKLLAVGQLYLSRPTVLELGRFIRISPADTEITKTLA